MNHIFFLIAVLVCACSNNNGNLNAHSRKNYPVSRDTVDPRLYDSSKIQFADTIRSFIEGHLEPYNGPEDDKRTIIEIDTVLFSPLRNRVAFFVLTKNSNDKWSEKGSENEYHYNGYCFLGERRQDSTWRVAWLDAFNFTNYRIREEISTRLKQAHFQLFNQRKHKGESLYKYNLDDPRFWDGPVWKMYFGFAKI